MNKITKVLTMLTTLKKWLTSATRASIGFVNHIKHLTTILNKLCTRRKINREVGNVVKLGFNVPIIAAVAV